ncbi:hypothetical protein AVEN_234213-1 [Araneus ventricosus]|uniref:Reverse transcriptase domain-containing protein n=1 Tax=Araneus ventricosus TaxID=182803 RepID=A0A4Y2A941_ARAVE|nr:hypothetical protein AVEN_234213-1 [Araneus ventricosus]
MENSEKGTPTEFGLKIMQKLYPKIAPRAAQIQSHQTLLEEEKFSQQEIDDILKKIPNGKAPGYDDTLSNRKVAIQTNEGPVLWEQTQGCPQGSCSGPAFWNIVADEILSVQWPQGVYLQEFADDIAFIVTDNTRERLRKLSKLALDKFKEWADKNKLHVSM